MNTFQVNEQDMIEFYSKYTSKRNTLKQLLNIGLLYYNCFEAELINKLKELNYSGEYRYYEIFKFLNTIEYDRIKINNETMYEAMSRIEMILFSTFDAQAIHPYMYKGKEFIATSNHKRYRILASSVEKAFQSNIRTFDTYIKTSKWRNFYSRYNPLKQEPYRIYKQFTNEYCGYYILPELLPDFIEYITNAGSDIGCRSRYINIIHKLLDKEYSRESMQYKDCAYALLIYKSEDKKTIKLHYDIKYQYEFGNDLETRNIITYNTYYLLKVGSKSELKEYLKKLLERLQKTMLTFKPTKMSKYVFTIEKQELQEAIDIINNISINDDICSCNNCHKTLKVLIVNEIANLLDNHLPNPN